MVVRAETLDLLAPQGTHPWYNPHGLINVAHTGNGFKMASGGEFQGVDVANIDVNDCEENDCQHGGWLGCADCRLQTADFTSHPPHWIDVLMRTLLTTASPCVH